MILLDVPRLCNERGISNTKKFLMGLGFFPGAAINIIQRKRVRLDYDQIEKLCIALNCTPNELFAWKPVAGVAPTHPLHELIRTEKPSIPSVLARLSPEKLEHLREIMLGMAEEGA